MKLLSCVLSIYICLKVTYALPRGLVQNQNIVFNAVPANPRFPVIRPKPEATTFIPITDTDENAIQSEGSGFEDEHFKDDEFANDTTIEPRNLPINNPCRIGYETIYEVEEVETEEEKCTTVNEYGPIF